MFCFMKRESAFAMTAERYFAFISYSRKDMRVARFVHRKLESFRYPAGIDHERRPQNRKFVRDVFIDLKCLASSQENFRVGIREAIRTSRYLIVICSRHSARPAPNGSHFVNDEINYFLETHGQDTTKVIPVLLGGGIENFPPALATREFSERNNPIVFGEEEGAAEEAVAHVLNYLLDVELTTIRARMNSQRLRFMRICAVSGLALAMLFSAMSFGLFVLKRRADDNRRIAEEKTCLAECQEAEAKRQKDVAQDNMRRAEAEAKVSASALTFMMDTFRKADPVHAGRSDMTMSEALLARVPEIGKVEPPELRSLISVSIGSIFDDLGECANASNLIFSAVDFESSHRPGSPEHANALYCASWWYSHRLRYDLAWDCARRALKIYETDPKVDPVKVALVDNALGVYALHLGGDMLDQAESYLMAAIEIRRRVLGAEHPSVAVVYCNLGFVYLARADQGAAIRAYESAIRILRVNFGSDHAQVSQSLLGIGIANREMGDYSESLENLKKALQMRIRLSGESNRYVVRLYKELGLTYRDAGECGFARASFEKALQLAKSALGEDDPAVSDVQLCLRSVSAPVDGDPAPGAAK